MITPICVLGGMTTASACIHDGPYYCLLISICHATRWQYFSDGVSVKRVLFLVIQSSGLLDLLSVELKCPVPTFICDKLKTWPSLWCTCLSCTWLILMTVCFIWVILIFLLGVEGVSRYYWETRLPLLIVLIYRVLL